MNGRSSSLIVITSGRMLKGLKRISVAVDCDDAETEKLATRIIPYLISLGALNVKVAAIEEIIPSGSNK